MIVYTNETYKYQEHNTSTSLKRQRLTREHVQFLQNLGFTVNHDIGPSVPNVKRIKKFYV